MSNLTNEENGACKPVDPFVEDEFLASFEGARVNDQSVIAKLNEELDRERAKVKALEECLEQEKKANSALGFRLEQAKGNNAYQAKKIMDMEKLHNREIRGYQSELNAASIKQLQSVAFPCIMIAIFAVLSLLVGFCVDRGWMVAVLAELLICAFLCVAAFFGGIVWDRLKENKAVRGSKNGNG